jgi:hypothetical protein
VYQILQKEKAFGTSIQVKYDQREGINANQDMIDTPLSVVLAPKGKNILSG